MAIKWTSARFRIRAEIGGTEFDDVVQFTSDFEPNNIPRASIAVPVGRGYKGNRSKVAPIHAALSGLFVQQPAKVWVSAEPLGGSPGDVEEWPDEFVAFEGNAVGTGWRRGESGAQFVIYMLHWLADLHYSSSVSSTSHPLNPKDFTFNAAELDPCGRQATGATPPSWVAYSGGRDIVDVGSITSDLWGEVLKPWMECIASQDRINKEQIPGGATKNDSALKALERMAPGGGKDGDDCYVETSIDLADVNGEVIAENIRQALYRETYESWSQVTLWGKLIGEWVPSFFLGLVPRVEDAIVIPFTPGLREEFKSIKTSEYNFTSIEATMPRVPRAVGIFHTVQQLTGLNAAFDSTKSSPGLAGYFEPDGAEDGLVILKDAPGWLTDDVLVWLKSKNTTGSGKQDGEVIGTAMHPGEGPDEAGIPADDTRESMGSILNNFAQQWYIVEMLKGRQGEISGKLRWDIAPYSTIKLEALGERFTPGDQLASPMWGTVMRVSTQINSEQSRGATAFSIAHIRNEAENGDDKTSIDSPPLYTNKFTGCSLADGF